MALDTEPIPDLKQSVLLAPQEIVLLPSTLVDPSHLQLSAPRGKAIPKTAPQLL